MITYYDIRKCNYKYVVGEDYTVQTNVYPYHDIITEFAKLTKKGILTIKKGFYSDGPSGPTIDTKSFMRGAFVHDAFYYLLRLGVLPAEFREDVDKELRRMCLEDGMNRVRAWWVYHGVRFGGGPAASIKAPPKPLKAP